MLYEGPLTIGIVGKADFNPSVTPILSAFFPASDAVGVIQKNRVDSLR